MENKKVDDEYRSYKNRHDEDETSCEEEHVVAIHSQVMKIKREFEKIKHPALLRQPELRRAAREITSRQRSRSPLGLGERPISVGH